MLMSSWGMGYQLNHEVMIYDAKWGGGVGVFDLLGEVLLIGFYRIVYWVGWFWCLDFGTR